LPSVFRLNASVVLSILGVPFLKNPTQNLRHHLGRASSWRCIFDESP
jgi:hypothetical protein